MSERLTELPKVTSTSDNTIFYGVDQDRPFGNQSVSIDKADLKDQLKTNASGNDTEIQFNDNDDFGSSSSLKWDETDTSLLIALVGKLKAYGSYIALEGTTDNNIRLTTFGDGTHIGINKDNSNISSIYLGADDFMNGIIQIRGANAADQTDIQEYARFLMTSDGLNISTFKGKLVLNPFTQFQINSNSSFGGSHGALGVMDIRNGNFFFNFSNDDYDFRVDGVADNLIRTNAALSLVGINKTPDSGNTLDVGGKLNVDSVVNLKSYTVSTLPTGSEGDLAYVTDALTPSYRSTVTGGGSERVLVFKTDSNWVCH